MEGPSSGALLGAAATGFAIGALLFRARSTASRNLEVPTQSPMTSLGTKVGHAPSTPNGSGSSFTGKVAVVTGASRGIGREITSQLANHGAQVFAVDRDMAMLTTHEQEAGCKPLVCDLSDAKQISDLINNVGAVDMLVNCAGIAKFEEFLEAKLETWDVTMDINARAIFLLIQGLSKGMKERGGGAVVNISSQSSSVVVSTKHLCYSTSKAAVDHITRNSAIALASSGIRVNAVNPTVVSTELAIQAHGVEGLKKMAAKVPLGSVCTPSDVANAVLFLLSDHARMITGVTLPVDGGFVASRP